MLRFLGSVGLLGALAVGAMLVMPREWIAEPVSTEPRSMMGSGFVNDWPDVGPWTWWWSKWMDLRVDAPGETNIVIWNHHTEAMGEAPSCMGEFYYPPPSIMALEAIGRTRVYYLCTRSEQGAGRGHFALQRREEILEAVRGFRAMGVPAERIFLAGQSGGSCSSLFALGAAPGEMNAGILFAPACFGMGEGRQRRFGRLRPREAEVDEALLEAESITAMLVAFGKDNWNMPGDLGYLADPYAGVEVFTPGCGADHSGAFHGCGLDAVAEAVRVYFLRRLAAAGVELPDGTVLPPEGEGPGPVLGGLQ